MICTILLNDLHDIVPQSMRYRGTIWAILSDLGFEFIFNFDETFRRKVALHDNHHKATDEQSVDSQGAEHRQTGVAQADECKQTRGDERIESNVFERIANGIVLLSERIAQQAQ